MDEQMNRFWHLVEPEYPKVRGFCQRLTGDPNDGDDLLQDALVRALTSFADLKNPAAFRSWLYRIIINTFRSRLRQPWLKRLLPLSREIEESAAGDGDPAARHTAKRRLRAAMAALSAKDRALVTLFELEGWTLAELSEMTGYTVGSLKTRLSRSRGRMRRALAKYLKSSAEESVIKGKDTVCAATKPVRD